MLSKEYQEHNGDKDGSTLYVHFTHGSGDGDKMNRLDAIKDDNSGSPGTTLASYEYLGAATVVEIDYEEPDVRLPDSIASCGLSIRSGMTTELPRIVIATPTATTALPTVLKRLIAARSTAARPYILVLEVGLCFASSFVLLGR